MNLLKSNMMYIFQNITTKKLLSKTNELSQLQAFWYRTNLFVLTLSQRARNFGINNRGLALLCWLSLLSVNVFALDETLQIQNSKPLTENSQMTPENSQNGSTWNISTQPTAVQLPNQSTVQDGSQSVTSTQSTQQLSERPPTVGNINTTTYNPFTEKVLACITSDAKLLELYTNTSIQEYISQKFNINSKCEKITQELTKAMNIMQKVKEISEYEVCNIENIDSKTITKQDAETRLEDIHKNLDEVASEHTKYFIYTTELAKIENCITFYSELQFNEEVKEGIKVIESEIAKNIETRRPIIQEHGLTSFYGERNSPAGLGIVPFITDIGNRIITVSQAKNYAVIELEPDKWQCTNPMDDLMMYTDGLHNIAIPIQKGKSYACDKLPHDLLILQKKIENPKKEYSLFIFKLLE